MYRYEKIKGYEEYSIDTNGIIYSKKGKPLKPSTNHGGYQIVNLLVDGKRIGFSVHTLVANQFIPNNDELKTQINHKDGNKANNQVENLEWVTPKENIEHAIVYLGKNNRGSNSSKAKCVEATNKEITIRFNSISDAAKYFCQGNDNYRYKVNCIYKVLSGIRKTYKGFTWKYII